MTDDLWRARPSLAGKAVRFIGTTTAAWITLAGLWSPVDPLAKMIVAGVAATTLWNPASGLLALAGLAPLGSLMASVFDIGAFRLTEAIVLAFFGASLIRPWPDRRRGPCASRLASIGAALFSAAVIASVTGLGWRLSRCPRALPFTLSMVTRSYLSVPADPIGLIDAARVVEGIGLAAATVALFRVRPALAVELPATLAASAVIAALSSLAIRLGIGPAALLAHQALFGSRVAAHVLDLNAAGSYFVQVLCLMLGMAARESGSRRWGWMLSSAIGVTGLWLAGSRTGLVVAGVVVAWCLVWYATIDWKGRARGMLLAGLAIGVVVVAVIWAGAFARQSLGGEFRAQFNETSRRMIAARPLFGIGFGRYYSLSSLFLTPQMAWTYGSENAHNNFLQVASELGPIGLVLAVAALAGVVGLAWRALVRAPSDWRLLGATAGVVAFLATALAGHPLLVPEVGVPFYLQLGLVLALGSSTLLNADREAAHETSPAHLAAGRLATLAIVGAVLWIAVSIPARARSAPLTSPPSRAVDGLYGWEAAIDGTPYRWSEQFASLVVPFDAVRVEIPVRAPLREPATRSMAPGTGEMTPQARPEPATHQEIEVVVDGIDRRLYAVSDRWTIIKIDLSPSGTTLPHRINFRADLVFRRPQSTVRLDGQKALRAGSADEGMVGIQLGRERIDRDAVLARRLARCE